MNHLVLVFDNTPLSHFARAGELDTLAGLVAGFHCVTTRAVREELQKGVAIHPAIQDALDLEWLHTVPTDGLEVLYAFSAYMRRLGNDERNAGEASVLAWAEVNGGTAFVDEQAACNVARARGLSVRRTLNLIINAYRDKRMSAERAQQLVDRLVDEDARFPKAARQDLLAWGRGQGHLPPA